MTFDAATAQLTSSILLAAITTYLMLTTVLQYDTRAGRIISVAYVSVTGTGILTASLPGDGTQQGLGALAAAGITLSFGLLRSGLRLQQLGGSSQLPLAVGASVVTAASVVVFPVTEDRAVPLALSVVFSAAFAAAAVIDSVRGPSSEQPSARVLQAVMLLVATSIVVVAGLIVAGTTSWNGAIDVTVAIGTTTAFSLAAMCVTALRAEDARTTWWGDDARGATAEFELPGSAAFRRDAEDRIERSFAAGAAVGLVWIEIENLEDMADAFGPAVRDRVVVHVGRVIRTHVPPFALIGHFGGGRFAVLTTARARRPVERVANAVRTGLEHRPDGLPVTPGCSIGTSVQGASTESLDRMIEEAQWRARRDTTSAQAAPDPS
ncbi:sensor domain-containing diguanylate cyclase [Aeromicrobium sp. Sec7.5]|uniref:sensor domain-containing diguanylate cyclase n=1 Tax=Aeromicrobium sp. Sec7.5 TaxID=3121276 RepID=UPI002FE4AB32